MGDQHEPAGPRESGDPGPVRLPRGTIVLVALASLTVTSIGISAMRGVLAPVLLTLILTICANPVRNYLQRKGVPQAIATGSVIVVMFALLAGFTLTLLIAVGQFAAMLPQYATEFAAIGATVGSWLSSLGISAAQVNEVVAGIDPGNILSFVTSAVGGVFSITGALVIILTMMILMSADAAFVPTILRQLNARQPHLVAALRSYASNVRHYMVVTTVLGVVQGALNAVALVIMGVPAALLWGILAFLCSFIPNIGYFFALIPPLVFGFLVGGWPTVIAVVIVYGVINAVVQSIIQPRVVGQAVSLSQTVTFFSVLFWAIVIGPIGAILAIPLTLLGKAVLIDANPEALLWRPAFGPTAETRGLKKTQDAEAKQQRKAGPRLSPGSSSSPGSDSSPGSPGSPGRSGREAGG
jgi:predicted PurR-regulated permease PerM